MSCLKPVEIRCPLPLGWCHPVARLLYGVDFVEGLRSLGSETVHMICTSPPYWGQRDYGVEGQIGREIKVESYIEALVRGFREAHRVLRTDGTLWLNLGDKLDDRDYQLLPHRVALALKQEGWCLRSEIIWAKGRPQPSAANNRPNCMHEPVFLFTKRPSAYYYDINGERERPPKTAAVGGTTPHRVHNSGGPGLHQGAPCGRRLLSVWHFNLFPYEGAHLATWPPLLVQRMIRLGTSDRGCCPHCGTQWQRQVESLTKLEPHGQNALRGPGHELGDAHKAGRAGRDFKTTIAQNTVGWAPGCSCPEHASVPSTVLDPFSGSGTSGQMALANGRDYIGIDINPEYLGLAKHRICGEPLVPLAGDSGNPLAGLMGLEEPPDAETGEDVGDFQDLFEEE